VKLANPKSAARSPQIELLLELLELGVAPQMLDCSRWSRWRQSARLAAANAAAAAFSATLHQ